MNTSSLIEHIADKFPNAVLSSHSYRGDVTAVLKREFLLDVARFVKEDSNFLMNLLVDITAVDYLTFGKRPKPAFFASSGVPLQPSPQLPDQDQDSWPGPSDRMRFSVVYHFYSINLKHRIRFVVPVEQNDAEVDSLTSLWGGANWLEREVWDMFGIKFNGHPDLRRILMYEEFEGHPLRKDYPVNKRQPLIGPLN